MEAGLLARVRNGLMVLKREGKLFLLQQNESEVENGSDRRSNVHTGVDAEKTRGFFNLQTRCR